MDQEKPQKAPPDTESSTGEAEASLLAAGAILARKGGPKIEEGLETWQLLESTAGVIDSFEEQILSQVFSDQNTAMDYMKRQRSGQVSILARFIFGLVGYVDADWHDFFQAAVDRGAGFHEEHPSAVPGALFGLGLALGDFSQFMAAIKSKAFYPDQFGRRRRMEATLLAYHMWEQGEGPAAFLVSEAKRFAIQFNEGQVDTTASSLFFLIEKEHPAAAKILKDMFDKANFSEANRKTALLLVSECRKHPQPDLAQAMRSALDKGLGRHDEGDRAEVVKAHAACSGSEAPPKLT